MNEIPQSLLTDLYEFRMVDSYLQLGMCETAVFEFFVRRLPPTRQFLLAAGLEQALDYALGLAWSAQEIAWLQRACRLSDRAAEYLSRFQFSGDIDAMPEGTPFFADEPIVRVTAALPEAQLLESRLMNILHYQTLIASKAARCRLVAADRLLIDFGLRRAHGGEAGLWAARASFIGGFDGTATVAAGRAYGIPVFGTMAHSYVQAHDSETQAFADFLRTSGGPTTLLVDTYDTLRGVERAADAARAEEQRSGERRLQAIRIDSGDLVQLAQGARAILDARGLRKTQIFCSGSLDEYAIAQALAQSAPIDGFGVGTNLDVSADAPALDCAYKLQEYAGKPRRKRSVAKSTWPGAKQVWRRYGADGRACGDTIALATEELPGEPLLRAVVRNGRRLQPAPDLAAIRSHARAAIERLPPALLSLDNRVPYRIEVSAALQRLADRCDAVTAC
ncbi:MAG: nicotinate phosphoribosyltransferase [Steroidobacteraceae bacterium]|nr:nicotinate phosphoribosyltransferase [Steroidobacteraceae bacterium]MDW8257968.1 nicotinate phosphoribosyltransferase [Gammaproteobacteria bacterium]